MRQQNGRLPAGQADEGNANERSRRRQGRDGPAAQYFVDAKERANIGGLSDDLAIVCPLIDGRMKDVAEDR